MLQLWLIPFVYHRTYNVLLAVVCVYVDVWKGCVVMIDANVLVCNSLLFSLATYKIASSVTQVSQFLLNLSCVYFDSKL